MSIVCSIAFFPPWYSVFYLSATQNLSFFKYSLFSNTGINFCVVFVKDL